MAPKTTLFYEKYSSTVDSWLLIALFVVSVVLFLPLPLSPFLFGAIIAIADWILRKDLS
jgi:hypothetical protein